MPPSPALTCSHRNRLLRKTNILPQTDRMVKSDHSDMLSQDMPSLHLPDPVPPPDFCWCNNSYRYHNPMIPGYPDWHNIMHRIHDHNQSQNQVIDHPQDSNPIRHILRSSISRFLQLQCHRSCYRRCFPRVVLRDLPAAHSIRLYHSRKMFHRHSYNKQIHTLQTK